jgi:hypothetical protein
VKTGCRLPPEIAEHTERTRRVGSTATIDMGPHSFLHELRHESSDAQLPRGRAEAGPSLIRAEALAHAIISDTTA